ncbi:MAG TPA: 1-deoxy-D-xylulose-5-phosphate reductoisomerase [Planctomycetes bacterium]|nr:1-deoxy-D-xylulose-5-phosphate reductoisomerase [Planctomycetota bacterium]
MNRATSRGNSKSDRRRIAILGSTGSIGKQALEVVAESHGVLQPVLISAGRRIEPLLEQAEALGPERIVVIDPEDDLPTGSLAPAAERIQWLAGEAAQLQCIREMDLDLVLNGITGAAGLRASLSTLEAGIDLALANKESLVTAGPLLRSVAQKTGAHIIPVDSEHGAILQCIGASDHSAIERIVLTASGGPFRGLPREQIEQATPEQALDHPTWQMGSRISVDSATLFNKVLEVIEARELFGLPPGGIEVVIHPQSIIHALVEFHDGSCMAQLSEPDMKVPIRNALYRGERHPGNFQPLDLVGRGELTFEPIDADTFPALEIGAVVVENPGTTLGAVFNAADEEAVAAFLRGDVGFFKIYDLVERALVEHSPVQVEHLDQVIEADLEARQRVRSWVH